MIPLETADERCFVPNVNSVKGHEGREDKRRNENFTLNKNRDEEMDLGTLRDLQFGKATSNGKPEEIAFEGFLRVRLSEN
jgi:hypothetical protein